MYFGGAEDKCRDKPQMFGKTEGDYITIMPPIKLKTILKPTIVFLILLLLYIMCPMTPLYSNASIQPSTFPCGSCYYLSFHLVGKSQPQFVTN